MTKDALFQQSVIERDPICRSCLVDDSTVAHHLLHRRYQIARHDIRNGVGLCYWCHEEIHRHGDTSMTKWATENFKSEAAWDAFCLAARTQKLSISQKGARMKAKTAKKPAKKGK